MNGCNKVLISIITSTLNASDALAGTIDSIRSQTWRDFEWIIVDGGSSDDTLAIIERNSDIVHLVISEQDDGIYDAFNKGIKHARGEWIYFLGAGDVFYANDVLGSIGNILLENKDASLVYGGVEYVSKETKKSLLEVKWKWDDVSDKWDGVRPFIPPHQGVFQRSSLFKQIGLFDTEYKIISDAKWLLLACRVSEPVYVDMFVCCAEFGGISNDPKYALLMLRESIYCNRELGIRPPFMKAFVSYFKLIRVAAVRALLPRKFFCIVADIYRIIMGKGRRWTID